MQFIQKFGVLALPAMALAQYGNGKQSSASPTATTASPASTASSSSGGAVHSVAVGQGGLIFSPNSITAAVGDQVEFHFASADHTVAQGDISNPCMPLDASAFYSGQGKVGGAPWTITINSTDPIWYYCSTPGHCQAGMVGVINAPSGQTESDFAMAASSAGNSKSPSKVQGGVFAAASSSSGSGTSSGSGSSSSTSGSTSASPSASSSQTGAAAGRLAISSLGLSISLALLALMFV